MTAGGAVYSGRRRRRGDVRVPAEMQMQHPFDPRDTLALFLHYAFDPVHPTALFLHYAFDPVHPTAQIGA